MQNNKSHIFIVEDEESIAKTLELNFKLENYEVTHALNGSKALEIFKKDPTSFDLILLDIMMPGMNGYDVFEEIKKINKAVPIIFITAKGLASDKIAGLKLGADDYIVKPFDLEELLLRVKNLLKRNSSSAETIFTFGNCSINFSTYEIVDAKKNKLTLSKREIGLLKLLTASPNKVISRDTIIEALWQPDENASSRTIDNYILAFRKYFEENPKEPVHFQSIRSVGYKFVM
jgi:two-component system alkaline phosphatase synthesis response regulator PhoP